MIEVGPTSWSLRDLHEVFCSHSRRDERRRTHMEKILRDRRVYELLEEVDRDLALKAQAVGCEHCGGALHQGDYPRKPRG